MITSRVMDSELANWIQLQEEGHTKIIKSDDFCQPLKLIGGLDISFFDQSDGVTEFDAVGALVILNFETLKVVYSDCVEMKTKISYKPGFLGFREEPFALSLFSRLQSRFPEFLPQILVIDGCGLYHPRGFGSASQIGLNLNIPTIGISKSFLKLDGLDEEDFILKNTPESLEIPVKLKSNNLHIATALYNGISKHPRCYVSIGHRVSLSTAVNIIKQCSISKIPEPIRQADLISREYIRKVKNK